MKSGMRFSLMVSALVTATAPALAQTYPDRPVKIEVGYVPGPTGPDFSARVIAPKLSELLGQPFIVENKPGAGGTLATAFVVNAPADGYTLLLGESGQLEIAPSLFKNLPYNTLRDLTPIGLMTDAAGLVVVSNAKTTNIKTLSDLVREAKARPGELAYGSAGIGSIHQMAMELFQDGAGVKFTHVPFKGGGDSLPAFLGGQVPLLVAALQTVLPYVRNGDVNVLAVTASTRLPAIPDTPSISEIVPGYGVESQLGLLAPAGLPKPVQTLLSNTLKTALSDTELRNKLGVEGTRSIRWMSPEDYAGLIAENQKKFARAIALANIKPE